MNNTELNKYILHYLKEDRTKSAIMLTSGWGTGKSHYIQNELIPFLKENGNYQCIVVSLYGLQDIIEISKGIYIETRFKFLSAKMEGVAIGKLIAKTLVKGITSLKGIDISKSEEDFENLYTSIDLTGKFIILEDIERSEIDILTVLGYVNNLVEQDGVKVLLVANEDEILNYNIKTDEDGRAYKVLDMRTSLYLNTKEKTISDTILYHGDLKNAIKSIILKYNKEWLKQFLTEDDLNEIIDLMHRRKNYNLRTFIFACQKIVDILDRVSTQEDDFVRTIFFSIIYFSMTIKNGKFPEWEGTDLVSAKLGTANYPLYRICYDYIRWQEFDINKVQSTIDAHKKIRLYDPHGDMRDDPDLGVLFNYFLHSEKDVSDALRNIEQRLSNPEDIPFYSYGRLAYHLIVCHTILGFDYSLCKERMISNVNNHGQAIDLDLLFLNQLDFEHDDERNEFADFSKAIKEVLKESTRNIDFSYSPDDIPSFYKNVTRNLEKLTSEHIFISKFDLEKFVDMVFNCSSFQLMDLRGTLLAVYRNTAKTDFLESDILFMRELVTRIQSALSEKSPNMDKIVVMQIKYLISNLQGFIEQLS